MKIHRRLIASIVTLCTACCLMAADKPASRVLSILEIETDDPIAYATWLKQQNDIAKTKLGVDNYVRVYQSHFDGRGAGRVRAVTSAATMAEMMKNIQAMDADAGVIAMRDRLRGIRKQGGRVLYQAVRWEGATAKGAHNYNTRAMVTDEAGYLKAIDELRGIFDANGLKDVKIQVYRTMAGRTDHSHLIVLNTTSAERLATLLDFIAASPQAATWLANSAKFRSVVSNSTSREITR